MEEGCDEFDLRGGRGVEGDEMVEDEKCLMEEDVIVEEGCEEWGV